MCGVMGSINVYHQNVIKVMGKLELRGRDGFGYVAWSGDDQKVEKSLLPARQYLQTTDGVWLDHSKVVLANTRAIPTTEFQSGAGSDLQNQQPFTSDRYNLVFNGLIANDKALIEKYDLKPTALVDTAMLIPLFEKVGVVEGMRMLDGSFAIIVLDKVEKKLFFGKNFMPLCYSEYNEELLIASLKEMTPYPNNMKEVEPYTCYEYHLKIHPETDRVVLGPSRTHSLYRTTRNKRALIICSSGTDSITTAAIYKHLGYDLTFAHFTYGQAAEEVELFAVRKLADAMGAKLVVYDARPVFAAYKDASKLLHQKEANPEQQMLDAESTLSYVPNRNAIFAMIVCALAESENCGTVAFGGQQMDSVYPDNTPDFVRNVDALIKYSLNWQTNIKFAAPLIHLIKHEIVKLGLALGVPFEWVCSCYYPKLLVTTTGEKEIQVCGKCGCCQFRFSSFKMLGVRDTQAYASLPSSDWFDGLSEKLEWSDADRDKFIREYVERFA